jgi:hypothetical protein
MKPDDSHATVFNHIQARVRPATAAQPCLLLSALPAQLLLLQINCLLQLQQQQLLCFQVLSYCT